MRRRRRRRRKKMMPPKSTPHSCPSVPWPKPKPP
jgi:hypothetical protein